MAGQMRRGIGAGVAILGAIMVLVALVVLAWSMVRGEPVPAAGAIWFHVDPGSLNLIQAVTERYLSEAVWQDVLFPVLLRPGWLILAVAGVVVFTVGWLLRRR